MSDYLSYDFGVLASCSCLVMYACLMSYSLIACIGGSLSFLASLVLNRMKCSLYVCGLPVNSISSGLRLF